MNANTEPWLAVALSWMVPGLGQVYCRSYLRGVCLLSFSGLISMCWLASMCYGALSVWTPILLSLVGGILLPSVASVDALVIAKIRNGLGYGRVMIEDAWFAFFLSILLPGAGHLCAQKYTIGFGILACYLFVRVAGSWSAYIPFLIGAIVVKIMAAFHAYLAHPNHRQDGKWFLGSMAFALFGILWVKGVLLPQVKSHCFVVCSITGPSMIPEIMDGSRVVVDRLTYAMMGPVPGDIIVFTPADSEGTRDSTAACKRVVAMGGETVYIHEGRIYVDGKQREVRRSTRDRACYDPTFYITFPGHKNPYLAHGVDEAYLVPAGEYFVLGDNSHYSVDSRTYGAVPRGNIIGRVSKVIDVDSVFAAFGRIRLNVNCSSSRLIRQGSGACVVEGRQPVRTTARSAVQAQSLLPRVSSNVIDASIPYISSKGGFLQRDR